MKQKVWFDTMQKGIANLNNHPNAHIEDIIELTKEESIELFESSVVSTDVISLPHDSVHMAISHIIGDCILGNILTLSEVELGMTTDDSPFGMWS